MRKYTQIPAPDDQANSRSRRGVNGAGVLRAGALPSGAEQGAEFSESIALAIDVDDRDVVYEIVPRAGSLEGAAKARADLIAGVLVSQAGHSMSLEAQTVGDDETTAQQPVIARQLLSEWPRDLWDTSWDRRTGEGCV